MNFFYLHFITFLLSLSVAVQLMEQVDESTPFSTLESFDLKSLYNVPVDKLGVVIQKLDELIKEASDHQHLLVNNVSDWKSKYLMKKNAYESSVIRKLNDDHQAALAKSDATNKKQDMQTTKRHYDSAKSLLASSKSEHALNSFHVVRSIIAKLMTGTRYPTQIPTTSPTDPPTRAPTPWVAPTPPTTPPTKFPTTTPPTKFPTTPPTKVPTTTPPTKFVCKAVAVGAGTGPNIRTVKQHGYYTFDQCVAHCRKKPKANGASKWRGSTSSTCWCHYNQTGTVYQQMKYNCMW